MGYLDDQCAQSSELSRIMRKTNVIELPTKSAYLPSSRQDTLQVGTQRSDSTQSFLRLKFIQMGLIHFQFLYKESLIICY